MEENASAQSYIGLAADIVSAYVSNNSLPTSELPALLNAVHTALASTAKGQMTGANACSRSCGPDQEVNHARLHRVS